MATLLNAADRNTILERLGQLQPSARPRWGNLTAPKMVCHLADQLRVALGDLAAKRTDTLPGRTLVKWLVIYTPLRPPPGKIQTAPEMLTTSPTTWAADVTMVEQLIGRMATEPTTAVHPYFGPLTHSGWARLA